MHIPTGAAQVNLKFTGAGVPFGAQCTFGVSTTGASNPQSLAIDIADAIDDSNFLGNTATSVAITSILVKYGPNETGPMHEQPVALGGEVGAQQVPPNTCVLFRKSTLQGGRRGSGRLFLPGVPEAAVDQSGILSAEYVAGYQLGADNLVAELIERSIPMILLHTEPRTGDFPLPVEKLTCQVRVATQRRRLRG